MSNLSPEEQRTMPLSKERREEIAAWLDGNTVWQRTNTAEFIRDLLAAEAYWRDAVKNAKAMDHREGFCTFNCGGCFDDDATFIHKPDCPWVLANQ